MMNIYISQQVSIRWILTLRHVSMSWIVLRHVSTECDQQHQTCCISCVCIVVFVDVANSMCCMFKTGCVCMYTSVGETYDICRSHTMRIKELIWNVCSHSLRMSTLERFHENLSVFTIRRIVRSDMRPGHPASSHLVVWPVCICTRARIFNLYFNGSYLPLGGSSTPAVLHSLR